MMENFKSSPFMWGIAATLVILPLVAFASGFVVTRGWADEKAEQRAAQAVVDTLAVICVAQVPDSAAGKAGLAGLKAASYSDKDEFVTKQGWATMPGADKPRAGVAQACADRLLTASN